tara:strand:+ start:745 stop:1530 length:786 start_codon:yes stop_codon:yes gene_type:complete
MNFKILNINKKYNFFENYFKSFGLGGILADKNFYKRSINEMNVKSAYEPELDDLYLLHNYIIKYKRMTVLEFGTGWSTLVMANAVKYNINKYFKNIKNLRLNNAGQIHTIDNEKKWNKVTKAKTKQYSKHVKIHYSEAKMDIFNGRICTSFKSLPKINPDFIYLDGPDQFNINGNQNGINLNHNDLMPMSCDILKIENFLKPGTIIVVDGRAANSRFLKVNFQRGWKYGYNKINDQHVFYLNEKPLGKLNQKQLNFYFKKK